MERALSLFAAPADSASSANADTFNQKWDKQVQHYREVIKAVLQEGSMEDIVLRAYPYMKPGTNISASVELPDDSDDDVVRDLDVYADI